VFNRRQYRPRRIGHGMFVSECGILSNLSVRAPSPVGVVNVPAVRAGDPLEAATRVEACRELAGDRLILNEAVLRGSRSSCTYFVPRTQVSREFGGLSIGNRPKLLILSGSPGTNPTLSDSM
jgi:hypothetical protein